MEGQPAHAGVDVRVQPRADEDTARYNRNQALKLQMSKLLLSWSNLLLRIERLLVLKLLTEAQHLHIPAPLACEQDHLGQHCLVPQADV